MSNTDKSADVAIENHGTILLFTPESDAAAQWLEEHTEGTWWGRSLVVEPRYAPALAGGLMDEGYHVR